MLRVSAGLIAALAALLLAALLLAALLLGACHLPTLTSIAEIQGAGHTSPLVGRVVTVQGVVVAEGNLPSGDPRSADLMHAICWIEEEEDGDPSTSRGLLVTGASAQIGRTVRVTGTVTELAGRDHELTVTALDALELREENADNTTPEPVVLGEGGRALPARTVDDDGLTRFEPTTDGIDFWESLEGMRVRVPEPLVVGATSHGSLYLVADSGRGAGPRTAAGGLRMLEDDANPERIQASDLLLGRGKMTEAAVGDRFVAAIDGVVHYRRGHYELLPSSMPALAENGRGAPGSQPMTAPAKSAERLRVASVNMLNLSAETGHGRLESAARRIVADLRSPELLALQEVQDDDGPVNEGTVSAELTLGRLSEAVAEAGGPEYRWLQVDPKDNQDGGQPGGNIRVALLYDPERLALHAQPPAGFAANPAVVDVPAFRSDGGDHWSNCRKPLVAHLAPREKPSISGLYVIALHLSSKGPDDSEWGLVQPPRRLSEAQRTAQAEAVAEIVAALQVEDANARIVVLGDMNEYSFRPPLQVLRQAGLTDLVEQVPEEYRYTYVYRGNSIVLDHILVTPALAKDAEVAILHLNADQPAARQVSDHDPLVASLVLTVD